MQFPKIKTSGSFLKSVESLLGGQKQDPILVIGGEKLKKFLILKGYKISSNPNANIYSNIITVDSLPKNHENSQKFLLQLMIHLHQDGTIIVCEKSSILTGKRGFFSKLSSMIFKLYYPEEISKIFLSVGAKNIMQIWPQRLSSIVITYANNSSFSKFHPKLDT